MKIKLVARRDDPARPHDPPGGPMVQDYEALMNPHGSVRKYIGRRLDPTIGETFVSRELVKGPGGKLVERSTELRHPAFVAYEGPDALVEKDSKSPYAAEYRKDLLSGDLLPGDLATAKWAGVDFDPMFKLAAADTVGAPAPAAKAKGA